MRKTVLTAVVVVALTMAPLAGAFSAPAPTPGPGAPGIGDPYFPHDGNGGYDVAHYGIDVAYHPSTDVLNGRTTIRATATEALSRFNLDLVGLHVESVRVDNAVATWSRTEHELRVTPKKALAPGHHFVVEVRYHGVPQVFDEPALGLSGFFATDDGDVLAGQPHGAASWFPVNDHPLDKATYDIDVTVPKALKAVANGRLVSKQTHGSTTTWNWRLDTPMASYLATMNTGRFQTKAYSRSGLSFFDAIDPALYEQPTPLTGKRYALSGAQDSGYLRLSRTIAVPAGGGHLSFKVDRNTEPDWDYFMVEARRPGTSGWTTLPDSNGHTTSETGISCPYWLDIHPFLTHYESDNGDDTCSPTGSTGKWNAATGQSDGYENWSVDLSAYAGGNVQVALTVVSDDSFSYPGAWVDDIVGPAGHGSTSFEADGNTMDGWTAPGAPAGSPGNAVDWTVATSDTRPSAGERAQRALDREPKIIAFLTSVLGPYPFKQVGGIVDDDPGLGFALETQTRPVYSKGFFESGGAEDDAVVTHELAHQWTGDSLAVHGWRDIWLNEGFATYMEWLWSEDQHRGTAQEIYDDDASIPADDPFWSLVIANPGPDHIFDGPVYDRGAMTLHALRLKIGDGPFFKLLKKWTSTYAGGNVTTSEFIAMAEQVSGKNLKKFFDEWVYTGTKPAGLEQSSSLRSSKQAPSSLVQRWRHLRP